MAGTVIVPKLEEDKKPEAVEDLKTAETNGRQFSHGGKYIFKLAIAFERLF